MREGGEGGRFLLFFFFFGGGATWQKCFRASGLKFRVLVVHRFGHSKKGVLAVLEDEASDRTLKFMLMQV